MAAVVCLSDSRSTLLTVNAVTAPLRKHISTTLYGYVMVRADRRPEQGPSLHLSVEDESVLSAGPGSSPWSHHLHRALSACVQPAAPLDEHVWRYFGTAGSDLSVEPHARVLLINKDVVVMIAKHHVR